MSDLNDNLGFRLYTLWVHDDTMREIKHFAVDDNVSVATILRTLMEDYVANRKVAT